jgi:hypothetical protein
MSKTEIARNRKTGQLVAGLILLLVGLALTLETLGLIRGFSNRDFWPLIPVGFGLVRVLRPPDGQTARSGIMILLFGLWLFAAENGLISYRATWPLLVIGFGANLVWQAVERPDPRGVGRDLPASGTSEES